MKKEKLAAAVEMGALGGKARMIKMTPEQRSEVARKGGLATKGIKKKKKALDNTNLLV